MMVPSPKNSTCKSSCYSRADSQQIKILDCGASYTSVRTITIIDPKQYNRRIIQAYVGDGVLGQPNIYIQEVLNLKTADATITETGTQATVSGRQSIILV